MITLADFVTSSATSYITVLVMNASNARLTVVISQVLAILNLKKSLLA